MATTQLQVVSDLHLESPSAYDVFTLEAACANLVLLGDVGCVRDKIYLDFLRQQLMKFQLVFLILGNHEPYESSWSSVKEQLERFEHETKVALQEGKLMGKFVFLDQTRYDISDTVTLLGCPLYSRILPEQAERVSFGLNDFFRIQDWTVEQHDEAHRSDLNWLNGQVEEITHLEPTRKIVILTHHSPCTLEETLDPNHRQSPISSGFMSDLSNEPCWTNSNVKLWAFGHTHYNCDFQIGEHGKRILTNQRGYYFRQSPGFDPNKVITI